MTLSDDATIAVPRLMRVGGGAIDQLAQLMTTLYLRRPLIVTDAFLVATGAAARVTDALEAAAIAARVFDGVAPDPSTASLVPGLSALKEHGADSLIGFGGGSAIDSAKALALLGSRGGDMRDYKAPYDNSGGALPIIAIPSTAGSGSEATQFTIITDSDNSEKMLCTGLAFLPVAAIVDYELTMTMPARLTADTGLDALTHAIEAYVSRRANRFSDGLALRAITMIGAHLRRVYRNGGDVEAREEMMFAATLAGIAFSNSSVALVHGMSRPIGAHFGVAHGLSNAMLLPAVTAFSVRANESRYADCARALGVASETDADAAAAHQLVSALISLCREVDVPTPRRYGIDPARWDELIPLMARQALASGSPGNNPVVPNEDQVQAIYSQIYG